MLVPSRRNPGEDARGHSVANSKTRATEPDFRNVLCISVAFSTNGLDATGTENRVGKLNEPPNPLCHPNPASCRDSLLSIKQLAIPCGIWD